MEENLTRLLGQFRDHQRTRQILEVLNRQEPARLHLSGMVGSQDCFALSGTWLAQPQTIFFIAGDKEDAAFVQNTLANLLEGKKVHFLSDSFKRPMYFEELSSANVLERTEVITKITQSKTASAESGIAHEIVVTYPEALFEKVVAPQALDSTRIEIAVKAKLDVDFLLDVLLEYGFRREEFVFEPGQFSIRGGIVDIYSYGNELPYRVELYDDEVESIRTFDPASQLSQQRIARVNIVPNINTKFSQEQKVSILKILPKGTVFWIRDFQILLDKLQLCFEKAFEFSKTISSLDESELAEIFRDRAFIQPRDILEDIRQFTLIFLSKIAGFPDASPQLLQFQARPQPSFNKNFKLLIENLHENSAAGIENYFFMDQARQVERFYTIFEDLDADVKFHPVVKGIHHGFVDLDVRVACYTDHQVFERYHAYRLRQGFSKDQSLNLKLLRELRPGDFVTHIDHGVGRYSGLEKLNINGQIQEAIRLVYLNNDLLYVSINSLHKIAKYIGQDGTPPKLHKLGSDAWENLKRRTKAKVKDIAKDLIKLYAKRKAAPGVAFSPDNYLQNELEASFIYEDTPDQFKATNDVKEDMMKPNPMDRLICGDVGFGKTEVAIRAAFKAVTDGKQVAVLVPTTILALQHFRTFSERLNSFGVTVDYLNRFRSARERKEILENVKAGKIEIIIGTHALLNKEVVFKDLGLLIVDEEQKFGVAAKERLRNLKVNVDTLTLTATPIPRTLQFSLMAARDMSVIRTPPPNRQPIHTETRVFNEDLIKDAIYKEAHRSGQVFFVHNRVKDLPDLTGMIQRLCPDLDVGMAHGQMDAEKLEAVLLDFIDRKYDVLVCTNIIETGLDIPNANTIIINNAHHFGLSDLHQLRGRVGRSNKKAYCYLFSPPLSVLTHDARKRLKTIEEHSELGSGFDISMRDLDIRGAGNLLGGEQSGFIADIGYETYQKILEEAIQELKETDFKEVFKEELEQKRLFVRDVVVDTDVEMHIPSEYVESIQERLNLYAELDAIESEEGIAAFAENLRDRFGKLPHQVLELFEGLRLRWIAKRLGFEQIVLKTNKLRCYFVDNPQSPYYDSAVFQRIFAFIGKEGERRGFNIKKSNRNLILAVDGIRSLRKAKEVLEVLEGAMG